MFRLDRNRHGGGVIMYILKKYTVKVLSIVYDNLVLLYIIVIVRFVYHFLIILPVHLQTLLRF